jgi:hypothetical protein
VHHPAGNSVATVTAAIRIVSTEERKRRIGMDLPAVR